MSFLYIYSDRHVAGCVYISGAAFVLDFSTIILAYNLRIPLQKLRARVLQHLYHRVDLSKADDRRTIKSADFIGRFYRSSVIGFIIQSG